MAPAAGTRLSSGSAVVSMETAPLPVVLLGEDVGLMLQLPGRWLCWGQSLPPVRRPETLRGFKHRCNRQAFWKNKTNHQNSAQRLGTRLAWGGWVSSSREGQGWPACSTCPLISLEEKK